MTEKKHLLNESLGKLTSFRKTSCGLSGKTENAQFEVSIYKSSLVRVRVTREAEFEAASYAVIAEAEHEQFHLEESKEELILTTDALTLTLQRSPLRFRFSSPEGKPLSEDDPSFGTSWIGDQVTTYKKLQSGERFIGLGEKTGPLDRKGNGYQNWNTDKFAYGPGSDPLYCTTPFYIGIHNGMSYGIFFDNSHKTHFNFGASNDRFSSFSADAGEMDYYFMAGDVPEILAGYTYLTGSVPLPPVWSIGYQQCRYSYYPDKEVLTLANTFREKDIPADVIVLDIHYMEKYKIFTWDKEHFPDPQSMIESLKKKGFHVVVMCDPGIKVEEGYAPYDDGMEKGVFVNYPDGSPYSGEVWPGWCHFPDFTDSKARAWWGDHFDYYTDMGIDGFWNDMNEIAVWGQMMPELMEFSMEGERATSRKARNIYGMQMARSTYEGAKSKLKGKRPFNLTRAGYSGIQRYAAVWTGDNLANDEHMLLGIRMVNSMGLAGIINAGYDIGGFVGDCSSSLFARWISIGAFSPFFRGHSMINSSDSEPWSFGETVEEISRNYIKLRYRLTPYVYSGFYEGRTTGMPLARTLAITHTHDPKIYHSEYENQYLFGPAFLIAPVESYKDLKKVYLPEGEWYTLFNDTHHSGNQEIIVECPVEKLPVFVKGSSIVPMQSVTAAFEYKPEPVLELHVYRGTENNSYTYYEDDGTSFEYENGDFHKRNISYLPEEKRIILHSKEGHYPSHFKQVKLYLHGFDTSTLQNIKVNGNTKALEEDKKYLFIQSISNFDPYEDFSDDSLGVRNLPYVLFENEDDSIEVNW